ncbi:recombinase family protein [Agromyces sp. ISL-38]|uniref:recombinase family protein n=1 Tax=Agromyces sp. ISL-38 TaxID=2819107 RepID=UPI001BEC6982|nr:recombinase family protein [Agromyces sp. ISL-38]MBT2499798.1 recombinase family protein [Agromyces sp. ISL-38]
MTSKPRAVLYVRLSRDSDVSTSIAGQNADLYMLADREGWEIVATFEDNGKGGGRQRENARAALDMLRDAEADVLAVYAYDRWSRMGIADSAEVIKAIYARQEAARKGQTPPPLFYAAREGIRSDQEGWEIRVAFAADVAQKERDRMVARRTAAIARMRAEGRNPGNGPAPFGYRSAPFADGRPGRRFVPDEVEADLICDVASRLVRGESTTSLAKELTARRVPMPRSAARLAILRGEDPTGLDAGTWSSSRVSQLWTSEHLLGRVTVRTNRSANGTAKREGEVLLDPATGFPLQAYEPILDLATMLTIRSRFASSMGRGQPRKRRAARLLSGWAFCGLCGQKMYVTKVRHYAYYRCAAPSKGIDCPGAKMRADNLEALVVEDYLATFGDRPAVEIVEDRGAPEVVEQIARLVEKVESIGRAFAEPSADVPALVAERAVHVARLEELRAVAQEPVSRRVDLGKTWGQLFIETESVELQRGYLADAYRRIDVYRAKDPERFVLHPAATPEAEALADIARDEARLNA